MSDCYHPYISSVLVCLENVHTPCHEREFTLINTEYLAMFVVLLSWYVHALSNLLWLYLAQVWYNLYNI